MHSITHYIVGCHEFLFFSLSFARCTAVSPETQTFFLLLGHTTYYTKLTSMEEHAISVSEPLNSENTYDNLNIGTATDKDDHPTNQLTPFNRMMKLFFYLFSECLLARILACTFICQAAVMWLGTALNFILHLLFFPFAFSASSKSDTLLSSHIYSFLGSYCMIPGIIAFSAHYFWFLLQIGCHCFTTKLRMMKNFEKKDIILFF